MKKKYKKLLKRVKILEKKVLQQQSDTYWTTNRT